MRRGLRATRAGGASLQCRTAGHTLLVHPKDGSDPQAAAFAAGLAHDPQHTLAVVDLPFGALEDSADAVARLLASRGKSLRLVFGRATPHESRRAAQRIAERLGRLVLAPDGRVRPTFGGGLFIPTENGAGWLRFRPGRPAERDSRRFPKPRWEFSTFDRPWTTSGRGIAEPVASGVWVRSPHSRASSESSQRLVDRLPSHPDILTVVLGSPGGPPVTLSDVTRLWDTVLPSARPWVRFLHLGPVALPEGAGALGQELADTLGQQVVLYAGVPVQDRVGLGSPDVVALRPDGTLGHRPFVGELMYFPRTGGVPAPPALFGLRRPLSGAPEISTGVYEYAADAVLEVVQSGLWMRPSAEPADGDAVRRIPASPGHASILYDRSTPGAEERMRSLAEDMLWKLDPDSREGFLVVPADEPGTVAGATDDAYLWSAQDPAASGPHVLAPALGTGPGCRADVAPWAPASAPLPQAGRKHTPVRADGSGRSSALAHFNPDVPSAAASADRGNAAGADPAAEAPHPPRTESDAPSAALPRIAFDAGGSVAGDVGAPGDTARAAPVTAVTGGLAAAPERRPAASHHGPKAPHNGPDANPDPAPSGRPPTPPDPTVRGPVAPGSARPAMPGLPIVSRPGAAGEAPQEAPRSTEAHDHAEASGPAERQTDVLAGPPASDPRSSPAPVPAGAPDAGTAPGARPAGAAPTAVTPQPADVPGSATPEPTGASRTPAPPAPGSQASEASPPVEPEPAGRPAPSPVRAIRLESDSPAPVAPSAASTGSDGLGAPDAGSTGTPRRAGARVQPVPKASACAVPPERGTDREREWMRRTFSAQYHAVAGTVSRVMSESPGLRGGGRGEASEALTDLAAVRLYLSGDHAQVNEAVRSAVVGPHIPLARCVAAGLRRLPSYRGAALLRARASAVEREWYRQSRLVTEWAFCSAYSVPHPGPEDATDFLIWSMTARRTNLIDPSEPYRVVFLPGTTFKVLRPSDGEGPVMMRELSPSEIASDGKVDVQQVPLDEIALDGLERAAGALRANDSASAGGDQGVARPEERFGTPPGLISGLRRKHPRDGNGDVSAPHEGAKQ
ncbi:hypothetical protein [Streptomyces sp. MUM 2J]|uniref:hypothetical protein n=1 Tax=Streptomyces sp. MUM 2J TaxID=2791987 RepID=UPI001F03957C|nr:hypothetical protein [Streptomyces sp. MUM 2J]MCH0567241.1 hypothetical protein [Streptomyces sp. MUM 2J]